MTRRIDRTGYAVTLETNATPARNESQRPGAAKAGPGPAKAGPGPAKAGPGAGAGPSAGLGALRVPTQAGGLSTAFRRRFRMPGTADPKVRLRRLALVAMWATLLGLGGLGEGVRVLIGL